MSTLPFPPEAHVIRRVDRGRLAAVGIVLAIVMFVALNIFGGIGLKRWQLDLTQNQQFTLSDGTRELLAEMTEPVTLRFYESTNLRSASPYFATYAERVRDVLQTYADASNGRIMLERIDPDPFSVEEDRAVGFGLQGVPIDDSGTIGYLGLAGTNLTDDIDVLPFLSPDRERFLEYDLTRLVYNLSHPEKPVVGLISGLRLTGGGEQGGPPWQVVQQLRQFFEIEELAPDGEPIPPNVDLLMVVHPVDLDPKALYAIDQFVLRKGKALVMVDPFSESIAGALQPDQPGPTTSTLEPLFKAWGLEMLPGQLVGDNDAARQVGYNAGGRQQVVNFLPWLALQRDALSQADPVTAQLEAVTMASAGILKPLPDSTTTFTPLVQSSPRSMAIAVEKIATFPDPFALLADFKASGERYTMAARVTGPVKSAYGDTPPEGVAKAPDQLTASASPVNIVVFADSDLLTDQLWTTGQGGGGGQATPIADNANLVVNALDSLVGSDALLGLRGRDITLRPFTLLMEIRKAADAQYQSKEHELQTKLTEVQAKLQALEIGDGNQEQVLTPAQKASIETFRAEMLQIRQDLRGVQLALRQDIERIEGRVKFINIAAVPLVVALIAVILALVKRWRYGRRLGAQAN